MNGLYLQALSRLKEMFGTQVKFQKNEEAVGYRGAVGQALKLATGKYLVIVRNGM
jgi:hypothetical protein